MPGSSGVLNAACRETRHKTVQSGGRLKLSRLLGSEPQSLPTNCHSRNWSGNYFMEIKLGDYLKCDAGTARYVGFPKNSPTLAILRFDDNSCITIKREECVHDPMRHYDATFGDDRKCDCGHPYYRHFDPYDEWKHVGCKYCGCHIWHEPGTNSEPFFARYLNNSIDDSEIDRFVEYWHNNNTGNTISEYLGMTSEQYARYVENKTPDTLWTLYREYWDKVNQGK